MSAYIPPPASLPPGATVWAYLRDSGGPTQGESIDRQRVEIREYCARHGLRLVHVFQDEARSGGSISHRDEFDLMINQSSQPDHPTGLLIWDYARFSRSLDDSEYYKAVLRKRGLVVHSITDAIPDGPYSRIIEMVIGMSNEEKRRQVSRDTASGLRRIIEQYGAMPGKLPTGYKKEPIHVGQRRDGTPHILNRWVPDPAVAPRVLQAFEMRAAGASLSQIREATGLFASKTTYCTFFSNTVYKGDMHYGAVMYHCEPLVPTELWDLVQRVSKPYIRSSGYPMNRREVSTYLLSGLAYCQECGSPMNGYKLMQERVYYVCARALRRRDCSGRHIPARLIEQAVIDQLLTDILTLDNLQRMQSVLLEQSEKWMRDQARMQGQNKKRLASIARKIRNLTDAIGADGPTRALLDALHVAEGEQAALEYDIQLEMVAEPLQERSTVDLAELVAQIRTVMAGDNIQDKRAALASTIHRILMRREETQVRLFIEYHMPESKYPSEGGVFSAFVQRTRGEYQIALILPIRKYSLSK